MSRWVATSVHWNGLFAANGVFQSTDHVLNCACSSVGFTLGFRLLVPQGCADGLFQCSRGLHCRLFDSIFVHCHILAVVGSINTTTAPTPCSQELSSVLWRGSLSLTGPAGERSHSILGYPQQHLSFHVDHQKHSTGRKHATAFGSIAKFQPGEISPASFGLIRSARVPICPLCVADEKRSYTLSAGPFLFEFFKLAKSHVLSRVAACRLKLNARHNLLDYRIRREMMRRSPAIGHLRNIS